MCCQLPESWERIAHRVDELVVSLLFGPLGQLRDRDRPQHRAARLLLVV